MAAASAAARGSLRGFLELCFICRDGGREELNYFILASQLGADERHFSSGPLAPRGLRERISIRRQVGINLSRAFLLAEGFRVAFTG